MSMQTDRDVERILRSASFSNPAHKKALHTELFAQVRELDLDELALVAGGVSQSEPELWKFWPTPTGGEPK